MTQTGTAEAQYIITQITDEGLCERIVSRQRVTESQVSEFRAKLREGMRNNPAHSSDRIHVREA